MARVPASAGFKPEDATASTVAELREMTNYLFSREEFEEAYVTRKGLPKMNLAAIAKKLERADQLFLGAPVIENFTFVKKAGECPGSLLIYKDRLMFHTTASYRLSGLTALEKDRELLGLWKGLDDKARAKGMLLEGAMDKFTLTRLASFNKLEVIGFMQDVKSCLFGLSLKAF